MRKFVNLMISSTHVRAYTICQGLIGTLIKSNFRITVDKMIGKSSFFLLFHHILMNQCWKRYNTLCCALLEWDNLWNFLTKIAQKLLIWIFLWREGVLFICLFPLKELKNGCLKLQDDKISLKTIYILVLQIVKRHCVYIHWKGIKVNKKREHKIV